MIRDRHDEERAKRVVKYNEKFNVPDQIEKEEVETHENAEVAMKTK